MQAFNVIGESQDVTGKLGFTHNEKAYWIANIDIGDIFERSTCCWELRENETVISLQEHLQGTFKSKYFLALSRLDVYVVHVFVVSDLCGNYQPEQIVSIEQAL